VTHQPIATDGFGSCCKKRPRVRWAAWGVSPTLRGRVFSPAFTGGSGSPGASDQTRGSVGVATSVWLCNSRAKKKKTARRRSVYHVRRSGLLVYARRAYFEA
jgi:hypothetical protein